MEAGIFLAALGLAFAGMGLYVLSRALKFTQRSPGVITRVRNDPDSEGYDSLFATVRFRLADGSEVEAETMTNVGADDAVGKPVDVRYDPADPTQMDLASSPARIAGWALVGVGLLLGLIGLLILLASAS